MEKTALLVVSFGTSYPETLAKTIAAIETELQTAFPEADLFRAFTSKKITAKLQKRDGVTVDSPGSAMKKIVAAGYEQVICQTTHIINGTEYDQMIFELRQWASQFRRMTVGRPLLTTHEDFKQVTRILMEEILPLAEQEAWVFMGHGSVHHANSAYPAMNYYLERFGHPGCFMATVEGFPELTDVVAELKAGGYTRVGLSPFMVVAGDHAQNDMAGDRPDSWKNQLTRAGFHVRCRMSGLGENKAIRRMFVEHAREGEVIQ